LNGELHITLNLEIWIAFKFSQLWTKYSKATLKFFFWKQINFVSIVLKKSSIMKKLERSPISAFCVKLKWHEDRRYKNYFSRLNFHANPKCLPAKCMPCLHGYIIYSLYTPKITGDLVLPASDVTLTKCEKNIYKNVDIKVGQKFIVNFRLTMYIKTKRRSYMKWFFFFLKNPTSIRHKVREVICWFFCL